MVDYKITRKKCFTYQPLNDVISISCFSLDNFSDSDVTEFISDCLIHEHIHRVLFKFFDGVTCKLFDAIEYLFRNDELHKKHMIGTNRFTYQSYIKRNGFTSFLLHYSLDISDVYDSNILCNTRRVITKNHIHGHK